jgi:DUF4097 and DUF4098 domain-containing protein YvlB
MRNATLLAVVMLVGSVASAGAQDRYPARQASRETQTLALGPTGELTLETISGDVTLGAGTGPDVAVEIVREARGRTEADALAGLERVRADISVNGQRATVRAVYPEENRPPYSVSVAYNVTAPAGTRVRVNVVSGDITATGIRGALSLQSVSGDVRVADAGQITTLSTVSGDVSLERATLTGPLEATATSGDLTISEVTGPRLSLNSVSGDVTLRGLSVSGLTVNAISGDIVFTGALQPQGRYELQTHSGDIQLTLRGNTGFGLESESFSGNIRNTLSLQNSSGNQNRRGPGRTLRGTSGDGSAYLDLTTFSGDIAIGRE